MSKLLIGQQALYYPLRGSSYGDGPLAAIVTHVHSDKYVNLAIFTPNGKFMPGETTEIPVSDKYVANSVDAYCLVSACCEEEPPKKDTVKASDVIKASDPVPPAKK